MTVFMIIGGLVFGLFMFGYMKRSLNQEQAYEKMRGKICPCPGCKTQLIPNSFRGVGARGYLFRCIKCKSRSIWACEGNPPDLVESHVRRQRR